MKNADCKTCEFCLPRVARPGTFKFLGCTGGEYKGKWIAEIEECPEPNHKKTKSL